MSRGEAKRRFTLAEYRAATEGVECCKGSGGALLPTLPGCGALRPAPAPWRWQ